MSHFTLQPELTRFLLNEVGQLPDTLALSAHQRTTPELADAILNEAEKFAANALAPLDAVGDAQGCTRHEDGTVTTPQGWADAYAQFIEMGWNAATVETDLGGQGLPFTLDVALQELWQGANMAFSLCPLLTHGAIELLTSYGNETQRTHYLPWIISGDWTATMCMTEPHAGSDVGAIRTTATPDGDAYRIQGSKIFITYGEHDMAENILHLVLARLPDAPNGAKGISLFLVPKFLLNADGSLGARNDVTCAAIEHKLGIHGSPTAVMNFGEKDGAIGYLVGEENDGLRAMFTMMNAARLSVGIQGIAQATQATEHAKIYAAERVQGKLDGKEATINKHPDVKRMLLASQAHCTALRGLALYVGRQMDLAHYHPDETVRHNAAARVDLLIPVIKGHSTNLAQTITSDALQVFGGMGYVEETGIAQRVRDARITPIYEGTNGIQANDLMMRKILLEDGVVLREYIAEIIEACARVHESEYTIMKGPARVVEEACRQLDIASLWAWQRHNNAAESPQQRHALLFHASHYLELLGLVSEGYILLVSAWKALEKAENYSQTLVEETVKSLAFFTRYLLPKAPMLAQMIVSETE